jgi:diguanylate cyclase (GGDEF)-like protein
MREMAYHDSLTGLTNRQRFMARLEQEINRAGRGRNKLAIMYLDLNKFKPVNDELGHETGDRVLHHTGRMIKACFHDYDTVARIGGDEFSTILSNFGNMEDLHEAARRIIDAFSTPMVIDGMNFNIGISTGIAQLENYDEPVRHLLSRADSAMYEAKRSGQHACFSQAPESTDNLPSGN